mgnify:CR=1 FL=1
MVKMGLYPKSNLLEKEKIMPKKQGQTPYLAKGSFTANQLADPSAFHKRCVHLGFDEGIINFLYHTSMPKGHPDWMNKSVAHKTFMPEIKYLPTAIIRAQNVQSLILTHLWHGQELEHYAEVYAKSKLPINKGTRNKLDPKIKATRIADKQLKAQFRADNNLGSRGRFIDEVQEKCNQYVEKNIDNLIEEILESKLTTV